MTRPLISLKRLEALLPWSIGVLGILIVQWPVILSGFTRVATDMGDTRLVAYFLEHSFLWLQGNSLHSSFWNAPFYYPVPNTMALSEALIGAAPPYWLWRLLGGAPWGAFQFWVITWFALDYFAAYGFLRRILQVSRGGASLGAFLFAFGSPRAATQGHQQMLVHAYSVWALEAGILGLRGRPRAFFVAALFLALQFWSAFYLGWFTAVGLGASAGVWMAWNRRRVTTRMIVHLGLASILLVLLLAPLALHYHAASLTTGGRQWSEVSLMLPRLQSWLFMGDQSLLYGWTKVIRMFQVIPNENEQRLGIGWITLAVAIYGLRGARHRAEGRWLIGTLVVTFALVSAFWPGLSLWWFIYKTVPGADALRAVSRVGLWTTLGMSAGLASAWDELRRGPIRQRDGIALVLALWIGLEQVQQISTFDRQEPLERVAALVGRGLECRAEAGAPIYFEARKGDRHPPFAQEIDAMWAGLALGRPTINGYSGSEPKGYPGVAASRKWVEDWLQSQGHDPHRLCYVTASSADPSIHGR